jgi:hypothetical protein
MMYLDLTDPEEFDLAKSMLPTIKKALPYAGGLWSYKDVAEKILQGEMQMWAGEESVILTQLEVYPQAKVCHVFLAAGHLPEVHEILQDIEKWAAFMDCSRVTASGRKGWVREMKSKGYSEFSRTITKEL